MNSVISGVTEESPANMYTDLSWCPSSGSRVIVADENYNINNNNKFSSSNLQMDLSAVHRSPQDPELELHNATHSSSYNGSCGGYYTPTNNNNNEDYASGGGNDYYVQRYSPCYSVYDNSQENHDGNSVLVSRGGDEMCDNALDSHGNCIATGRPPVKRRNTANKKERRRTQSINNAFAELRDCIPNVPNDTKLSKIKTLRLARSYIAYLSDVLSGDDMCRTPAAFTAEISRKIGRGDEKRKKELLMAEIKSSSVIESGGGSVVVTTKADRKTKGRTGWPQHVWAQELQQ